MLLHPSSSSYNIRSASIIIDKSSGVGLLMLGNSALDTLAHNLELYS